ADAMQTEIGRKALVTALDVMIEREEAETETQLAPQAARDLANPPSPQGQLAPIQPKTAAPRAEPERASAKDGGQELSVSSAPASAIEFEDSASDAGQAPSIINADHGVLMETAPFRPVTRPHYHEAFPEVLGKDFDALVES